MPATLTRSKDGTCFEVGIHGDDFSDVLALVKSIPGRRWDAKGKKWQFSADDPFSVQRLVQTVQPELGPGVKEWLTEAMHDAAETVATKLPDDATIIGGNAAEYLYPYQRAGVDFLAEHPHSILADDMGLGKTIQSIAAVYEYAARNGGTMPGRKLIVCPNSSALNWAKEIKHWVPTMYGFEPTVMVLSGSKAKREKIMRALALPEHEHTWLIINYEKLRIVPELVKFEWAAIIADESHRAKNRKAQQTKALWKLRAPLQFALSGTPIMNRPDELWAILKWLQPTIYTSYWRFFEQYVKYYEGHFGRVIVGVNNPDGLRFELANQMARRTKKGVLDLPEKTRVVLPVEMGPKQRRLYDQVLDEFWVEIAAAAKTGDESAKAIVRAAISGQSLMSIPNAAARTTRLRQVASSTALLGEEDHSAKLDAAVDLILDGGEDRQWVVFAHFKGTVDLLANRLAKHKISTAKIDGDVKVADRQANVEAFQAGTVRVLICTIAAGGVALTLTAADSCIFIEQDWVPANNVQAEDRLHRIGQKNAVTIYLIEAIDSVDTDKISPTNARKKAIVASIIESDD